MSGKTVKIIEQSGVSLSLESEETNHLSMDTQKRLEYVKQVISEKKL